MHIVHAAPDADLSAKGPFDSIVLDTVDVIAVLFNLHPKDVDNPCLGFLPTTPPREGCAKPVGAVDLDCITGPLLGSPFYSYPGSLTRPPCIQGVTFHVFEQPVLISSRQLAALSKAFPRGNNRPVQPLDDRVVYRATR